MRERDEKRNQRLRIAGIMSEEGERFSAKPSCAASATCASDPPLWRRVRGLRHLSKSAAAMPSTYVRYSRGAAETRRYLDERAHIRREEPIPTRAIEAIRNRRSCTATSSNPAGSEVRQYDFTRKTSSCRGDVDQ